MSRIKGNDIRDFTWSACTLLVELDVTEMEPGEDFDKDSPAGSI